MASDATSSRVDLISEVQADWFRDIWILQPQGLWKK